MFVKLFDGTYSETLSTEVEDESCMEMSEPYFSYVENFSSPTGRRVSQISECLVTFVAPSTDYEFSKELVFHQTIFSPLRDLEVWAINCKTSFQDV